MEESDLTQFKTLITERLILRRLSEEDATAIASLRSDEEVNRYIDRPGQVDMEGAKAFIIKINENIARQTSFYWAICLKDNPGLIGTICLFNFSDDKTTAELGYELSPAYQGKGLACEGVKEVILFAFKTAGFKILEACVHKEHVKSVNLLLKNNFVARPEKKVAKYPDYNFFALRGD